jgi:hypothetical protein
MSKHTPGPWHVNAGDYKYHIYYSREQSDHYFVEVDGNDDDEAKANARLIAAAPELLAALKTARKCLKSCHYVGPERETIDAAIAKAEATE